MVATVTTSALVRHCSLSGKHQRCASACRTAAIVLRQRAAAPRCKASVRRQRNVAVASLSWDEKDCEPEVIDDDTLLGSVDEVEIDWKPETYFRSVAAPRARPPRDTSTKAMDGTLGYPPRRLFVCVDETGPTARALKWAREELARPHDTFVLVHIVSYSETTSPTGGPAGDFYVALHDKDRHDAMVLSAERLLETICMEFVDHSVELYCVVERTPEGVASVLMDNAKELDASVIIVGSGGKSWWEQTLLGSVSGWLLRHESRLPLVVVH